MKTNIKQIKPDRVVLRTSFSSTTGQDGFKEGEGREEALELTVVVVVCSFHEC